MIRRLRWKFVLINMLLVIGMLAAICAFFITSTRESLRSDSESVLQRVISETETPSWSGFGDSAVSRGAPGRRVRARRQASSSWPEKGFVR